MAVVVTEALLNEVKNFLDVTWNDEALDEKLSAIILRGMQRINSICDTEFDYSEKTEDAEAKDLLLNYIIYARSNAIEEFMKNYAPEINRLQLIQEAKRYAEKQVAADEEGQ